MEFWCFECYCFILCDLEKCLMGGLIFVVVIVCWGVLGLLLLVLFILYIVECIFVSELFFLLLFLFIIKVLWKFWILLLFFFLKMEGRKLFFVCVMLVDLCVVELVLLFELLRIVVIWIDNSLKIFVVVLDLLDEEYLLKWLVKLNFCLLCCEMKKKLFYFLEVCFFINSWCNGIN